MPSACSIARPEAGAISRQSEISKALEVRLERRFGDVDRRFDELDKSLDRRLAEIHRMIPSEVNRAAASQLRWMIGAITGLLAVFVAALKF